MKIDYKKELEAASKSMIMIHDPKLLIKLIVRMIVRKLNIKHAGMIVYDPRKDNYVLTISKGETGVKIPSGFARFNRESPLIKVFTHPEYQPLIAKRNAILSDEIIKLIWQESVIDNGNGRKELLHKVEEQLETLNTVVGVPAYYQDKLLAILLLGNKYDASKFEQDELDFFSALASDVAMAIRNAQLFEDLKAEAERNRKMFIQTIIVLGSTIEAKDSYTHGHTERVTQYSLAIARQMTANGTVEFPETFFENLYIAGMLHDIGKIAVPEAILNKRTKLTEVEYEIMQQHTLRGAEIVKPLNLPKECIDGIKYHHEFYNGAGYPEGLAGAAIPISAAIIAVADTFDAMTTNRPYRNAMSRETAIQEIKRKSGTQFNPLPAQALIELFEQKKI